MRKNLKETFDSWKSSSSRKISKDSVSTDGVFIYSYSTPILRWIIPGAVAVLNETRYSKTTSSQQNGLRYLLHRHDILFEEVNEDSFKEWDSWNVKA